MLLWLNIEQDLGLIKYSPFQNRQIDVELNELRSFLDDRLNTIYDGIIAYEDHVLE